MTDDEQTRAKAEAFDDVHDAVIAHDGESLTPDEVLLRVRLLAEPHERQFAAQKPLCVYHPIYRVCRNCGLEMGRHESKCCQGAPRVWKGDRLPRCPECMFPAGTHYETCPQGAPQKPEGE